MKRTRFFHTAGYSLVETMLAGVLLALVLMTGVSMTLSSTTYFGGATGTAWAESDVSRAARLIETALAEARDYQIAPDGQSITYYATTGDPNVYPPPGNPAPRRFERDANNPTVLRWTEQARPLLTDVPVNETNSTAPLILFGPPGARAGDGRPITVTLVVSRRVHEAGVRSLPIVQRTRTRVSARNVPPPASLH